MIVLNRKPGWRTRLEEVVDHHRFSKLAYGSFDCAVFAHKCIYAITHQKVGPGHWWRYRSERSGLRTMIDAGFSNLGDMTASELPELEHPSMAVSGDIGAVKIDNAFGFALGVVEGESLFVLNESHHGLGVLSFLKADRAFKVG